MPISISPITLNKITNINLNDWVKVWTMLVSTSQSGLKIPTNERTYLYTFVTSMIYNPMSSHSLQKEGFLLVVSSFCISTPGYKSWSTITWLLDRGIINIADLDA